MYSSSIRIKEGEKKAALGFRNFTSDPISTLLSYSSFLGLSIVLNITYYSSAESLLLKFAVTSFTFKIGVFPLKSIPFNPLTSTYLTSGELCNAVYSSSGEITSLTKYLQLLVIFLQMMSIALRIPNTWCNPAHTKTKNSIVLDVHDITSYFRQNNTTLSTTACSCCNCLLNKMNVSDICSLSLKQQSPWPLEIM